MTKNRITLCILFLCLFLASNIAFATGDNNDRKPKNSIEIEETTTDDGCGFFCSLGEFFEDLFS